MNLLGIGGFSHDSAVCLMQEGQIVAAAMAACLKNVSLEKNTKAECR